LGDPGDGIFCCWDYWIEASGLVTGSYLDL
jgi:hypothetical protein